MVDGEAVAGGASLRDRLDRWRSKLFVGREPALSRLDGLLEPDGAPLVVYVWGAAGVGKTELMAAFARRCGSAGVAVDWLDCARLAPHEASLAQRLRGTAAEPAGPRVIILDTFEHLAPVEGWLRTTLFPTLSGEVRLAIASRQQPDAGWSLDPGWRALFEPLPLDNLSGPECLEYLARRGVPEADWERAVASSHGHPLTLVLLAEVLLQQRTAGTRLEHFPSVVQLLLDQLFRQVPTGLQKQALWCSALVLEIHGALLDAMLDRDASAELRWLEGLSFMRAGSQGIAPHELVREVLLADLCWREPSTEQLLRQRASDFYLARMEDFPDGRAETASQISYLWRGRRSYLDPAGAAGYSSRPARLADWPAVEAMARRHEGARSAELIRFWWDRGGDPWVILDPNSTVVGFALHLWVDRLAPEDLRCDPATAAIVAFRRQHGPHRGAVLCIRSAMSATDYQSPGPVLTVLSILNVQRVFANLDVGESFSVHAEADRFLAAIGPGPMRRCREADFVLDGRSFGMLRCVFRPGEFVASFRRFFADPSSVRLGQADAEPLDRSAFQQGLMLALRQLDRPDVLAENPLASAALVRSVNPSATAYESGLLLRRAIIEACEQLRSSPRDEVLWRVLAGTYLEPGGKQLQVADTLNMPFGTYRHQLSRAVGRLTSILWDQQRRATGTGP